MNRAQVIETIHSMYMKEERPLADEILGVNPSKKELAQFEKRKGMLISKYKNEGLFKRDHHKIWQAWYDTKKKYNLHKKGKEYWHQFVSGCIYLEKLKFMTVRTLRLFREFEVPEDTNFKLEFGDDVKKFPSEISKLIWMADLFEGYTVILRAAGLKMSFDTEERRTDERRITGRIDWKETLRKSQGLVPTSFETSWRRKEFVTPENILLITCAFLLHRRAKWLLAQSKEELLEGESQELIKIIQRLEQIRRTFPFQDVVDAALKKYNMLPDSPEIVRLEKETEKRLNTNLIDNRKAYGSLLEWFRKFKRISIASPENASQQSMVVLATHNIDTLYEFWIFLEVLRHFSKKSEYKIVPITTGNSQVFDYFETRINGKTVKFHFNKQFTPEDDSPAWTTGSTPDMTITVDGKIVAVLDAKNYESGVGNKRAEASRTMLGYMMNLQAPMGGLFFPHWSKRFEPMKGRGVLEFSMPIKASWIQMDPSTDVGSIKINSDSIRLLEEQLCEFMS